MTQEEINKTLIKIAKRAEKIESQELINSFVDVGPLMTVLNTIDNQVVFGRRGTGKTHALRYLKESQLQNDICIYIDLRNIGSSGGIYSDQNLSIAERATRLLMDTLSAIHEKIFEDIINSVHNLDLSQLGAGLDQLADAITQVRVVGQTEIISESEGIEEMKDTSSIHFGGSSSGVFSVGMSHESSETERFVNRNQSAQKGQVQHVVQFGELRNVFNSICDNIGNRRIFLLLDEWSSIPNILQPYLADMLRRSVLPISGITIKIGAIEKRSNFQLQEEHGEYIGLELGADIIADINLDDYMLFDNDSVAAESFFEKLLFRHFSEIVQNENFIEIPTTSNELISISFSRRDVFTEFVRASEGIPRDAFSIISSAAQLSFSNSITMNNIRRASLNWYNRDKESAVSSNSSALALLHWIIDTVIATRRSRAFLLSNQVRDVLIDSLFDSRVLHILKSNISAHDAPGLRYDVYKIDYGCYVDLLNTSRAPQGLFQLNDGTYEEVPPDDYRSIRRAILDIYEFYKQLKN